MASCAINIVTQRHTAGKGAAEMSHAGQFYGAIRATLEAKGEMIGNND
jgi:hypothetical protein